VPREPELIAPEEIAEAAWLVLSRELRVRREDLVARVAKLLGFARTGRRLRERIGIGVDHLLVEQRATEKDGELRPI